VADKTGIEWTDATWNPIRGCAPVSAGCKNCYAADVARRFSGPGGAFEGLVRVNAAGERTNDWNGRVRFIEERLLDPIGWAAARRIFVNSVSDLFHEAVTDQQIDRIFAVMAMCPQHTFQVLTKRPRRMLAYFESAPYPNVQVRVADIVSEWIETHNRQWSKYLDRWPVAISFRAHDHFGNRMRRRSDEEAER
jgi:protein gp37